jgi:hypothetical protein
MCHTGEAALDGMAARQLYNVSVSVLEVRNVPPRRGLGAAITANCAPLASVTVRCGPSSHCWLAPRHGTDVTFDTAARHTFPDVVDSDSLDISVADQLKKGSDAQRGRLSLPLSSLDLTHPLYLWLSAEQGGPRLPTNARQVLASFSEYANAARLSLCGRSTAHFDPQFDLLHTRAAGMLVYVRVHAAPSARSQASLSAVVDLAGAGVIVSTSAEEELLALSMHNLHVAVELRMRDASIVGSIRALQIDDQSLDAQQPVVLGPAGVVTAGALSPHPCKPFLLAPAASIPVALIGGCAC